MRNAGRPHLTRWSGRGLSGELGIDQKEAKEGTEDTGGGRGGQPSSGREWSDRARRGQMHSLEQRGGGGWTGVGKTERRRRGGPAGGGRGGARTDRAFGATVKNLASILSEIRITGSFE